MVCCTCSFKIVNIAKLCTVKGLTSKTNKSQLLITSLSADVKIAFLYES